MKSKMLVFASIGFELVGLLIAFGFFGDYLDKKYAGDGLWLGLLMIAALVGWLAHVLFMIRNFGKDDSKSE